MECVFCDIIDSKINAKRIYEDENVVAILDLSQVTFGHSIVIPKKHVRHFLDADEDIVSEVMKAAHHCAKLIIKKCHASGCNILMNCEAVAGQTVEHMHVHIIPRYDASDEITIKFHNNQPVDLMEVYETITR